MVGSAASFGVLVPHIISTVTAALGPLVPHFISSPMARVGLNTLVQSDANHTFLLCTLLGFVSAILTSFQMLPLYYHRSFLSISQKLVWEMNIHPPISTLPSLGFSLAALLSY